VCVCGMGSDWKEERMELCLCFGVWRFVEVSGRV
jgi:hypothetical protein